MSTTFDLPRAFFTTARGAGVAVLRETVAFLVAAALVAADAGSVCRCDGSLQCGEQVKSMGLSF